MGVEALIPPIMNKPPDHEVAPCVHVHAQERSIRIGGGR